MKKEIITTLNAPAPLGPYNQAVKSGNTLYISGQIPIIARTMELFSGTIKEETELVMSHLNEILEAADMHFEHVVKTSIFLDDMENFGKVNDVYGRYFDNDSAPARETVAVKTLPKNVRIEISMIAIK
ncbi:Rid family detoxifying hydrolase [Flavobacteriaceae bacterium]|jgi:2-iminobutanoate/2-iminopropanoate deaminase|nr:RidA family protein [Flavobacteriaceae bacterium]MDA9124357.1 Rid family detoxifying hydrolase [bacterium]MBT4313845.1 RidA family protein [Flavobacteriaceae bacterium]MBT5090805.1 RidA family protein [Flavobacteriaceae bacterium]MBT5284235.1 RidA family protein [Flavobacteriaceae bacterium]